MTPLGPKVILNEPQFKVFTMTKQISALVCTILFASFAMADSRPATVLLVTDASLVKAWQPFVHWKTRQGKATRILTTAQIKSKYKGDDIQQMIRAACLDHINNHGTQWIILGGDSQPGGKGLVPDRDTPHVVMGQLKYPDIPTDLYYISEKDWDANDDGVYGEWKNDRDEIEYTNPKACIGRIPVRSPADVKAYTQKVIAYESKYPSKTFAKQMIYTCPVQMAYPKLFVSGATVRQVWKDGKLQQFFAHKTPWDSKRPGDYELSPSNWVKMINDRSAGKLHMHGHGFLPVWVLEGDKTINPRTVSALKNENAYPVITTVSCFTGQYDAPKDPSITELMIRRPNGGAIAIIAPSREGVPIFSNRDDFRKMVTEGKMDGTTTSMTNFWKFGLKDDLTIGEAFRATKAAMAKDAKRHSGYHWCQCELNLLGDPTLDMRARDPMTPTVKAPSIIAKGKQTITIETDKRMTVCVWKGDEVYGTASSPDGTFRIDVSPSTDGKMLLTVYGPSANTWTGTIVVK